jgi:hypothetical protein
MVSGIGYDRAEALGPWVQAHHDLRRVITNLAVLDFECHERRMRLRSVHPGVSVAHVVAATGFELAIPDHVPVSRAPSDSELAILAHLDPSGLRRREVPDPQ